MSIPTSSTSSILPRSPAFTASTVVIDTSVWASRLLPHDSNHQPARTWIDGHIMNGGFFVAPLVFVIEVASAIARETRPPNNPQVDAYNAVNYIYALSVMRLIPMDQTLVDEAADLAAVYGIRGADAMFVAVARRLSLPLVTFDGYQLKQPPNVVVTIKP